MKEKLEPHWKLLGHSAPLYSIVITINHPNQRKGSISTDPTVSL